MPRKSRGQSLVEFVIATTVLIPIFLLLADASLIACALQLNDKTCSNAARLASIGNPNMVTRRAQQAVSEALVDDHGPFSLELVAAGSTVKQSQMEALYPYGGQVNGIVRVSTEVTVRPLILSWFLTTRLGPLRFQTSQAFPCTYMMPNVLERASI